MDNSAAGAGSVAVSEPPAVIAGLDDVTVVGEPVEERSGHLGVAEDAGPFAEGQVGGDDHRGALVEFADKMEQALATGLGERQVAQLVEDHEIETGERTKPEDIVAKLRLVKIGVADGRLKVPCSTL